MVTANQQQHHALQHQPSTPLAPWPEPPVVWQLLHAALHFVQLKSQDPEHEAHDVVMPREASTGCGGGEGGGGNKPEVSLKTSVPKSVPSV